MKSASGPLGVCERRLQTQTALLVSLTVVLTLAIEKCLHDQHPSTSTSTSTLIIIIISIISVIIITTAIIIFLIIIIVIIIIVIATALSSATGAKRWTPRQQPTAPTPADPGSRLDLPNLTTTIGVYLSNCLHFFGGSLF